MNEPSLLRRYVREVLALAPTRKFSERMIFDAVNRLTRDPLAVDEMKAALQWNLAKRLVSVGKIDGDDEHSGDAWTITKAGLAKEGLA